jgi:xanthine dehydrogenase accessory factor
VSEILDVLAAIESLHERGQRMALATVIAVRGSTYRRPGARLLVPEEGAPVGNISGGCLEADIADVARSVMSDNTTRVASWDLTADDDAVWGLGLGCNGAIDVFIEPADRAADLAGALRAAIEQERPIGVVTVLRSDHAGVEPGARVIVSSTVDVRGSLGPGPADAEAVAAASELLGEGGAEVRELDGGTLVFVEAIEPPPKLLVCGAGHDAISLVRGASFLGWKVTVVDDRPALLNAERFPEAGELIAVDRPGEAARSGRADRLTHVVVMTHNFLRDKEYLRSFASSPVPYLAVLGPAARTERLLAELGAEGCSLDESGRRRIHAPAGLDLGSENPEEIAVAILAEMVAVRRRRPGGFLRDRDGPIHDREAQRKAAESLRST